LWSAKTRENPACFMSRPVIVKVSPASLQTTTSAFSSHQEERARVATPPIRTVRAAPQAAPITNHHFPCTISKT
jgi:hypothetical protein